ncbi:histidine phosphatase family protein [Massilia sp. W12]|uniref:histidine phosphatase family protein n=1 Tax=Massilia sp. W12 TaxID=3126507 RepID=UPI0030D1007E
MMAQAFLIRHPQVEGSGLCYGRTELDVTEQALQAALARCLPDLAAVPPLPLLSSPALRARRLALAVQAARGAAPYSLAPGFQEIDFGEWDGKTWEQIGKQALDEWAANPVHFAAPGGESLCDMAQRVLLAWRDLRRQFPQGAIVVCHGGPMRLLAAQCADPTLQQAAQLAQAALDSAWRPEFGALLTLPYPP